jgi:tetratricopeptide (TPR) repeat protein
VRRALLLLALAAGACSGPPWYMGAPFNGQPSIPPTTVSRSWRQQQREAARAKVAGEAALELNALLALEQVQRLLPEHGPRLAALLGQRAEELRRAGRAVPESRDLERLARFEPKVGASLRPARAAAARGSGDAWLAIGDIQRARAAYELARGLGAADTDVRFVALWGHPPPETTPLAELRAAIMTLPLRALPPFAGVYLSRGGTDEAVLARGLAAARQEGQESLAVRLAAALEARRAAEADGGVPDGGGAVAVEAEPAAASPREYAPPGVPVYPPVRADLDRWMVTGASVAARLVPVARAHPETMEDLSKALRWVDLALDEDPTSPDVLELAAVTFGRARRFGGTERMLVELVYQTPDRAAGHERAARVWEGLGRGREACVSWLRAARWRDVPDDPTWRTAIACARANPGVADPREIRDYVLARAAPARRAAVAEALDAP